MSASRFERVRDLFEAACELSELEQRRFLEDACEDDELRQEVLSLLAAHRSERPLFETGSLSLTKGLSEGDQLGAYRVIRELGRGGVGVVYLAEDTRLHRQVALKALGPLMASSGKQKARFRREAELASSLSHPGIATVYAFEEWDARQYIISEYVPGETLAEEFNRGPASTEKMLDIALQLTSALAAAHEQGVVHRDLKPHNVIRRPDGRVKVLDFGLAISYGPDAPHTRLTDAGTQLGTPAYMSPEQLGGESPSCASDVFSLGVILAEGLTGRHPFAGPTLATTMSAILQDPPRGLESLSDSCSGLREVVRRCLDKDPAGRFESAAALHQELSRLERQESAAAPPLTAPPADRRLTLGWWTFHQIAAIVFLAVLGMALWKVGDLDPGVVTRSAFIGGLASASLVGTLRIHLLFTSRYNRAALSRQLSLVSTWLKAAEWGFCLSLAVAAMAVALERRLIAAVLVGAAAAYVAVSSVVEPATRAAVFKDE